MFMRLPKSEARHRNGPHLLLERRLGCLRHARPGLGAEILDDDFLDVAVPLMHVADGKQRLDALAARFADADQDAGGERHAGTPGRLQHGKAGGRILVGGTIVRPARRRQSRRGRLQHDALRHGHPAQAPQPSLVHQAGIEMGQQSRFPQHQLGRGFEIVEGGGGSQRVEGAARGAVAQLGLVAEREQGLLAAGRASLRWRSPAPHPASGRPPHLGEAAARRCSSDRRRGTSCVRGMNTFFENDTRCAWPARQISCAIALSRARS